MAILTRTTPLNIAQLYMKLAYYNRLCRRPENQLFVNAGELHAALLRTRLNIKFAQARSEQRRAK